MLFDDSYKTIAGLAEGTFRDRGSKFMAYAYPIRHEEQIKQYISFLKAEHPKARHYCWAMRLGLDRSVFKLNDDGEPAGTAGRPILNTILSSNLTNILVVVVRYFGGTLLGVPGLINAYKTAAVEALNAASVIEMTVNDHYTVSFNYLQMNEVMKAIKESGIKVSNQTIENYCCIEIEIPKLKLNAVLNTLEKIENLSLKYLKTT